MAETPNNGEGKGVIGFILDQLNLGSIPDPLKRITKFVGESVKLSTAITTWIPERLPLGIGRWISNTRKRFNAVIDRIVPDESN